MSDLDECLIFGTGLIVEARLWGEVSGSMSSVVVLFVTGAVCFLWGVIPL